MKTDRNPSARNFAIAATLSACMPLAAPSHPLSQRRHKRTGSLKDHVQLVLTDRSPQEKHAQTDRFLRVVGLADQARSVLRNLGVTVA